MPRKNSEMTEKERIFLYLLSILVRPNFRDPPDFGPWIDYKDPKVGDLVLCATSGRFGIHPWLVAHVVQVVSFDTCLLREVGGDRLCTMSNESFYPIRGVEKDPHLLEGPAYEFYLKVLKAFKRGDEFLYRFGGIDIDGRIARIWVRARYGGLRVGYEAVPFKISMEWNKRITIKAILETMRECGYGTREFEFVKREGK